MHDFIEITKIFKSNTITALDEVFSIDFQLTAQELKEKGNSCVKNGNFAEAMLHYTHAIKLDPKNFSLYSNRSLAFLKMQHYYYALEDAKQTIELKPDWAKVKTEYITELNKTTISSPIS